MPLSRAHISALEGCVQWSIRNPFSQRASCLAETQNDDHAFRIPLRGIYWLRFRILERASQFLNACSIVRNSLRSFHGHIRSQSTKEPGFLGIDAVPIQHQNGWLSPPPQTIARIQNINKLRAIYPWLDNVDLRMFLSGFDAAERFYGDSLGRTGTNLLASPVHSSEGSSQRKSNHTPSNSATVQG